MNDPQKKKLWFKARRFGWGWTPIAWEGWTVLGVMLLIIIIGAAVFDHKATGLAKNSPQASVYTKDYLALVIADVLALVLICYRKGEQPHWKWGSDGAEKNLTNDESEHNHHD